MEYIFKHHNYSEEKKVKLEVINFTDYTLNWWVKLVNSGRRKCEIPIDNWEDIKVIIRKYLSFIRKIFVHNY